MTRAMRRRVSSHVYSAGVHVSGSHVSVLAGSRDVTSPCLRLLTLSDNGKLEAAAELARPGPSVRCSVHLEAGDTSKEPPASYLTGGEDGVLRLWRSGGQSEAVQRTGGKIGGHEVRERNKPYSKT